VLFFNFVSHAEDIETVKTKTVEDLCVRVFSSHGTTNNTPVDDKLAFCVWRMTTNNSMTLYMPTALEYVYRLELLDTNGSALPPTKLAEKIGVKFLDFKPSFANDTGFNLKILQTDPSLGGEHLFFPHRPGYFNGEHFYSPNDLFEIKQPGNYTLRIQFQFILRTGHGQDKTAHLVRFSPLDYPLVKLPNNQTNALPK